MIHLIYLINPVCLTYLIYLINLINLINLIYLIRSKCGYTFRKKKRRLPHTRGKQKTTTR